MLSPNAIFIGRPCSTTLGENVKGPKQEFTLTSKVRVLTPGDYKSALIFIDAKAHLQQKSGIVKYERENGLARISVHL